MNCICTRDQYNNPKFNYENWAPHELDQEMFFHLIRILRSMAHFSLLITNLKKKNHVNPNPKL